MVFSILTRTALPEIVGRTIIRTVDPLIGAAMRWSGAEDHAEIHCGLSAAPQRTAVSGNATKAVYVRRMINSPSRNGKSSSGMSRFRRHSPPK
jgi:hypothetical protein